MARLRYQRGGGGGSEEHHHAPERIMEQEVGDRSRDRDLYPLDPAGPSHLLSHALAVPSGGHPAVASPPGGPGGYGIVPRFLSPGPRAPRFP